MQELDEVLVMIDLEYLGKDEPNAQILDIGICYGTSPENLQRISYKPAWQNDGLVQPSTLKFWAELNAIKLASYMDNKQPMRWVVEDLYEELIAISGFAKDLGKPVVFMSKGITHDLPKLEHHLDKVFPGVANNGMGVFESMFGYNCRRDMRSFKMYRNSSTVEIAKNLGKDAANTLCSGETLHDAEWDAVSQWHEVYHLAIRAQ